MKNISMKKVLITAMTGIMVSFLFVGQPSEAKISGIKRKSVPHTKTVMTTDDDEKVRFSGVCEPTASSKLMDDYESYDVYYDEKNILTVKMVENGTQMGNGYYQVEFEIPGKGKTAFITGLTAENVKQTQESLIESYDGKNDFSIYSMDYIDTEKLAEKGIDSDLCWAGQAADMLTYAGWTKKAGFKDEDDVFELFSEVFEDEGGLCRYGFSWFMNGYAGSQSVKSDKEGGFLREYPYDMFFESDNIIYYDGTDGKKPYMFFRKMMKALRNGDAIGLDVDWVGEEGVSGAHAITLFGYIYNTSKKDTSLKYYDSFIIADSDNDKGSISNRRDASNSLSVVNAKPYKGEAYNSLILDRYGNGVVTTLERLTPYSEGLTHETDPRATKNVNTSPDLKVSSVVASTSKCPYYSDVPYLAAGQDVHVRLNVENNGAVGYNGPCTIHASLTDKDGKVLQTVDATGNLKLSGNYIEMIDTDAVFSAPPEGEYTIEGSIEPDSGIREAYLINNTFSRKITVKNTPIDPSAVTLKVSVPDFKDGLMANAKITYSDPSYILNNGYEYSIALSYLDEGKWSPYMETYSTTDTYKDAVGNHNYSLNELTNYKNGLIKTIDVGKDGTAVSVRLSLFTKDSAPVYYYSEPCELKYLSLKVNPPGDEVYFDPIPYSANALINDQNIEFSIVNNSTYDGGKVSGNYYLFAESWEDSSLKFDLTDKKNITLAYGENSGPIKLNKWTTGISPAGKYYVYVCFYNSVSKNEELYDLGVLSVCEKPSTKVSMLEDVVDPLDGGISLREAIAYAESGDTKGNKVTFEKYTRDGYNMLSKPLEITGDVTIDGMYKSHGYAYGHKIYSPQGSVFNVKKDATLTLNGLILENKSAKTGGAIDAEGANVTISNCRFSNLTAETEGGAIHAKKSKVLIKNSTFELCQAEKGGAIYAADDTNCHVLNCIFHTNNSLTESLIENKASALDVVASSLVENISYNEDCSVIRSDGTTRILGSVLCGNVFLKEVKGPVYFYGCALAERGEITEDAVLDTLTKEFADKSELYDTAYDYVSSSEKLDPKADMSTYDYILFKELYTKDVEGVIIQPTDSGLVYGLTSEEKLESKIPVLFEKEDYMSDMYGEERGAVYGSDATPYVEPVIGHAPVAIKNKQIKKKNAETYMGRAVSDAAKLATKADIALITTSAIQDGIKKGDVTAPMLNWLLGKEVVITVKNIKGKDIKKMLEKSIDHMLKDKKKYANKTLQLAGLTVTYKASAKKGNRIKQILVGSKKMDYKKTYKVAMDATTAYDKPYTGYGKTDLDAVDKQWFEALTNYFNKSSSYIKKSVKKDRYIKK